MFCLELTFKIALKLLIWISRYIVKREKINYEIQIKKLSVKVENENGK